jgi:cysteine desulfurase
MKQVYLDYAAATPCDEKVLKLMEKVYFEFGNPSSIHFLGERVKKYLEKARSTVAKILHARISEIIFLSGGTESINLALQGVARAFRNSPKRHIITSEIEHHAVLNTVEYFKKDGGFKVSYIKSNKNGVIDPVQIKKAIKKDTFLISIMYANNEIGTIQLIAEIGKIAKKRKIIFHTDACQAAGFCDLNVKKINVDLMTLNGSKIYGPKGIGCLYVQEKTPIQPLILGGGQEFGLRSGTENIPGIMGFAKALELVQKNKKKESDRLMKLRDYFIENIQKKFPKAMLVGNSKLRLPNNVYFIFPEIKGEVLVRVLSKYFRICCSTGSACSNINPEPSHVLLSLGYSPRLAQCGIRFSLGKYTKLNDINYTLEVLPKALCKSKEVSPVIF